MAQNNRLFPAEKSVKSSHLQRREQGPRALMAQDMRSIVARLGPCWFCWENDGKVVEKWLVCGAFNEE